MRHESPLVVGALAEDINFKPKTTKSVAEGECPFCRAPALKPNRKERRQLGAVAWVMRHTTWCRTYGHKPMFAGTPRPNGGAA